MTALPFKHSAARRATAYGGGALRIHPNRVMVPVAARLTIVVIRTSLPGSSQHQPGGV